MKKNYYFCILLFCNFLILLSPQHAPAQNAAEEIQSAARGDVESLRRQVEEQKEQIQQLRAELKEESEQRKQQQKLLENLLQKLENLNASPLIASSQAKTENPVAAATSLAAASPVQAVSQTKTDVKTEKQTEKSPTVEAGLGKIRINGLIQGWYAGGDRGTADTFRIRRAEMRFSGDLLPKVKWSIMFDMAKALALNNTTVNVNSVPVLGSSGVNQSSRVFQEAFVTLGYFKRANVQFGQFKIPVSQESAQSSAALDTVERALFLTDRARGGDLGDVRDIGVMAFGALGKQVDYQIGIFNGFGESQNDVDRNDQKIAAGRLVFHPEFVKGLQIGASGARGGSSNPNNPRRDRLGAEMVFDRKPFRFKSEFMSGVDGDVHRRGFYAHAGYRFVPKLEAIFRFDLFDPDIRRETNAANATERDFIAGFNYYFKDHNFKLQFNYLRKTFADGIVPSRNVFLANLQTSW